MRRQRWNNFQSCTGSRKPPHLSTPNGRADRICSCPHWRRRRKAEGWQSNGRGLSRPKLVAPSVRVGSVTGSVFNARAHSKIKYFRNAGARFSPLKFPSNAISRSSLLWLQLHLHTLRQRRLTLDAFRRQRVDKAAQPCVIPHFEMLS